MVRLSTGKDSKQNYRTPKNFLDVFEGCIGRICFDLAADEFNAVHENYYTADANDPLAYGYDAFEQDWAKLASDRNGWLWLNPPFDDISWWAFRCRNLMEKWANPDCGIALLVPASTGANWFRDALWGHSQIILLNGRLSFDGKHPYPKDCLLALFSRKRGYTPGVRLWEWRTERHWHQEYSAITPGGIVPEGCFDKMPTAST